MSLISLQRDEYQPPGRLVLAFIRIELILARSKRHELNMDSMELKRLKEAFVSDLEGTTKLELWQAISCLPLSILLGTCHNQEHAAYQLHLKLPN